MRLRLGGAATTITGKNQPRNFWPEEFLDNKFCGSDRFQFHVQIDRNFTSRSTSISGPDRPQFCVQIDLHFTSRSTSISSPDRLQFYVQIVLNFTSRSISILRPDRPQFYIQIDFNFASRSTSNFTETSPTKSAKIVERSFLKWREMILLIMFEVIEH